MPQVRGALLSAFALSFALGQFANAIGFQVLSEVSSRPASPITAEQMTDNSDKILECNLFPIRFPRSLPACLDCHS